MYRIPSLHVPQSPPSGFCEIGTLHSFQKTFFGTKIRPSFIQENEKKYNLAAAVKYYFDSRVEDRDNIIVGIGRYPPGKNLINVVQEKLITDTFWPWADAEICIKRKNPQENYRAYMIVNGVFEKSLVAHALRGFAQELYHPILHSLNQEKGIVIHRCSTYDALPILYSAERRFPQALYHFC